MHRILEGHSGQETTTRGRILEECVPHPAKARTLNGKLKCDQTPKVFSGSSASEILHMVQNTHGTKYLQLCTIHTVIHPLIEVPKS